VSQGIRERRSRRIIAGVGVSSSLMPQKTDPSFYARGLSRTSSRRGSPLAGVAKAGGLPVSRFRQVQSIRQANHKAQVVRVYTKACSCMRWRDARMRREAPRSDSSSPCDGVFFAGHEPTVYPDAASGTRSSHAAGAAVRPCTRPPLGSVLCANFREHHFHALGCIGQEPGPDPRKTPARASCLEGCSFGLSRR
jgi:hypothetical protein